MTEYSTWLLTPYPVDLPGPVVEQAPVRRPRSTRRTSHVDVTRTTGELASSDLAFEVEELSGVCRDLVTDASGERVVGQVLLNIRLAGDIVTTVEQYPSHPTCSGLLGVRLGLGFRSSAKRVLEVTGGSPFGPLVDDLTGALAPTGYALIRERVLNGGQATLSPAAPKADVCAGWREHGLPLIRRQAGKPVPFDNEPFRAPSLDGEDLVAWHDMPTLTPLQTRRMRRLDVWREDDRVMLDAMFRDVMVDPDGTGRVVHEYAVYGTVDPTTMMVESLVADPRALPFPTDCPFASDSAHLLVGQPVANLRRSVRELSKGPGSCTHLNDLYRSLSDIPALLSYLPDGDDTPD